MKTNLLLLTLIVLMISCKSKISSKQETKKQPYNVLFIAIDDLNDWTGFAGGHTQTLTPNMDKLAQQGVVFDKTYAASSLCGPSRAALLTGYRPSTTGVYGNGMELRDSPILKNAPTLPQWFSNHGYFTTARGKIFHKPNGQQADTISWDKWVKEVGNYGKVKKEPGFMANGIPEGEADDNFDWGPTDALFEETSDYLNAKWAADQLQKDYDKPFFLAAGIYQPHLRWNVPQEFFDKFNEDEMIIPEIKENDHDDIPSYAAKPSKNYYAAKKYNKQQAAVQAYLASINYADACVGVILDALAKSKYADNTIVVLLGDHGWHLGDKMRYKKYTLWEEACKTPLIIKVPGLTQPNSRCLSPVNLLDLYPTLSELAGLPINTENEGNSLVPLLKNVNTEWDIPSLTTMGFNRHTVRNKKWRYIKYGDKQEELYNHDLDPMEFTNLANNPKYQSVKDELSKYIPEVNADPLEKVYNTKRYY
jgi:arylsulfatase A-like enzyme